MATPFILKTVDPHALSWWRSFQVRNTQAHARMLSFGSEVTQVIGPCRAGGNRHDFRLTRTTDSLTIVGIDPEPGEEDHPPVGTIMKRDALVPDLDTDQGHVIAELLSKFSTTGILLGSVDVGIPSQISDGNLTYHASFGVDPISGALYQYWADTDLTRDGIAATIALSDVAWDEASMVELARAKANARTVDALQAGKIPA